MALRLAHIYLPKDGSGFLDDLRERFNIIEHYEIEAKNRKEIKLLLDAEMTEPVLDFIENRYGFLEGFRVIVTPVEAVIPRLEVEEKPEIEEEKQKSESEAKRIYREELYEDINSVSFGGRTFILLVILLQLSASCVPTLPLSSAPWSLLRCWVLIWEWPSQRPWVTHHWRNDPSRQTLLGLPLL